jgi:chaperone BCS1
MDIDSIIRGTLPTLISNATSDGNTAAEGGLPDGILDTLSAMLGLQFSPLIKLFLPFYGVVESHIGIDPTYMLISIGFLWAVSKVWGQVYATSYALFQKYLMASIEVEKDDPIYSHLMKWLAAQPTTVNSRCLTAETVYKVAWEEDGSEPTTSRVSPDGTGGYLNFSLQEAQAVPRFIPAMGRHCFRFRGGYFRLHRRQEMMFTKGGFHGMPQDKETLVISCFGRSTEPIKRLLQHAREQYKKTIVCRPSSHKLRRFGSQNLWQEVADRPARPLRTVA